MVRQCLLMPSPPPRLLYNQTNTFGDAAQHWSTVAIWLVGSLNPLREKNPLLQLSSRRIYRSLLASPCTNKSVLPYSFCKKGFNWIAIMNFRQICFLICYIVSAFALGVLNRNNLCENTAMLPTYGMLQKMSFPCRLRLVFSSCCWPRINLLMCVLKKQLD